MRAVVMREGELVLDEVPDPRPAPGQVLVRTIACGICGSDLHALHHADQMVEMAEETASSLPPGMPAPRIMDPSRDVILGHEFCGEVVETGENTGNVRVGDIVVSMPIVFGPEGVCPLGYSNDYPGGFSELMVLSDMLCLRVPNGLDPKVASLTEPAAVGVHAVNAAGASPGASAVVLGCGPVGLAIVAELARRGAAPIVVADFSEMRRKLAVELGAHVTVDPRHEEPISAWRAAGGRGTPAIFEAVGTPGMLDSAMRMAPRGARIVVVGVCMEGDVIQPMRGIVKELDVRFVLAYDPTEFAGTLTAIAEGQLLVSPMITGTAPLGGVPRAFSELGDPDNHAKILVTP